MSHISWIAAANTIDGIPAPLLSRFRVVNVRGPSCPEIGAYAVRRGKEVGLDDHDIDLVRKHLVSLGERPASVRLVNRLLDDLAEMASRPMAN